MKSPLFSTVCVMLSISVMNLVSGELGATDRSIENETKANRITFDNIENAGRWARVNDSVMGGVSTSTIYIDEGYGVFEGNLSLENNGGFASVRRLWSPEIKAASEIDAKRSASKIYLRVMGDGQYYQLRFRTSRHMDGVSYAAGFQTKKGEITSHVFDKNDFLPLWRGRQVRDAEALEWSDIVQVGIMITQKQQGPFQLKVASLELK